MARQPDYLNFMPTKKRRGRRFLVTLLIIIILLLLAMVALNLTFNGQVKLLRQRVSIMGLPKDLEGFRILHLSDLHGAMLGENHQRLRRVLADVEYDAVCMTGDMVGASGNVEPLLALIEVVRDTDVPIFFIPGDEDPSTMMTTLREGETQVLAPYIRRAVEAGAIFLDKPYALEVQGATIWFCPEDQYAINTDETLTYYRSQLSSIVESGAHLTDGDAWALARALEYQIVTVTDLAKLRKESIKEDHIQIALAHSPVTKGDIEFLLQSSENYENPYRAVNLCLSGHYNAGQWRVPLLDKALYVPSMGFFPDDDLIVGLVQTNTLHQYISPGLGAAKFYTYQPGRLFNPPSVTLITLTGKLQ